MSDQRASGWNSSRNRNAGSQPEVAVFTNSLATVAGAQIDQRDSEICKDTKKNGGGTVVPCAITIVSLDHLPENFHILSFCTRSTVTFIIHIAFAWQRSVQIASATVLVPGNQGP